MKRRISVPESPTVLVLLEQQVADLRESALLIGIPLEKSAALAIALLRAIADESLVGYTEYGALVVHVASPAHRTRIRTFEFCDAEVANADRV